MAKGVNGYRKEKQRLFCQGHAGKKRFYKKVLLKWDEENVGTDDAEFIITIKKGFSFLEDDHLTTKTFQTVPEAMAGIHKIYTCGCDFCKDRKKTNFPDAWQ